MEKIIKIESGNGNYVTIGEFSRTSHSVNGEPSKVEDSIFDREGSGAKFREWKHYGKRHREDGPALMWDDNLSNNEYWLDDVIYSKESWEKEVEFRRFKGTLLQTTSIKKMIKSAAHNAAYRISARKINSIILIAIKKQLQNQNINSLQLKLILSFFTTGPGKAILSMITGQLLSRLKIKSHQDKIDKISSELRAESIAYLTEEVIDGVIKIAQSISLDNKLEENIKINIKNEFISNKENKCQ